MNKPDLCMDYSYEKDQKRYAVKKQFAIAQLYLERQLVAQWVIFAVICGLHYGILRGRSCDAKTPRQCYVSFNNVQGSRAAFE